jgi:hypothetical protein
MISHQYDVVVRVDVVRNRTEKRLQMTEKKNLNLNAISTFVSNS